MIGYSSKRAGAPVVPLTRDLFDKAIRDKRMATACAEIHDALESRMRGEMTASEFDTFKNSRKACLPIITPHALFKNGRRINSGEHEGNAVPTGAAMVDIDHMQGSPWEFYERTVRPLTGPCGVLLAYVSPSREGMHVIFRMPEGMTVAEAQRWMGGKLGIEPDEKCKDLARASYLVPEDYVLYVSDDLFAESFSSLSPDPSPVLALASVPAGRAGRGVISSKGEEAPSTSNDKAQSAEHSTPLPMGEGQGEGPVRPYPSLYHGTPYAAIVSALVEQLGGAPEHGDRNNFIFILACHLRHICDNDPTWIKQIIPTFGEAQARAFATVDSACQRKQSGTMTEAVKRAIHAAKESEELRVKSEESEDEDDAGQQTNSSLFTLHSSLSKLPKALKGSLAGVPQNLYFPVMAAVLPIAGALADQVEVEYCDGQRQRLSLMSIILGNQASGKSVCKQVADLWKRPLEREDADARKIEDEWKAKKKNRKANERCPEDPQVMIRVLPVTVSCSTLLKRLKNSRGHTLYSFGEELDTLRKTNGAGSWSSKYDIYRLGFDHGEWGQDYNSDQAESGTVKVAYNWTMLGTYGAMRRCFSKDNVENGLSSRVLVAEMPDNSFAPMPKYGKRTSAHEAAILEGVGRLRSACGFIDTPRLRKAIGEWVEQKRQEAMADIDRVKDTYRKRAAVIGFRAGVICHLLSGDERETKTTLQFATTIAELTLRGQMSVFGESLAEQLTDGQRKQRTDSNASVFDRLPEEFTKADLRALKQGFASEGSIRTVLYRWVKVGWAEKIGVARWKKSKRHNVTVSQ